MRFDVRRALGLLLAAVMAAGALTGCQFTGAYDLPLPGGNSVSASDGYTVTADFADVLNVVPRSAVMVSDVPVGQVLSVDRVGWHARVTMRVRNNIVLPRNATADIRQTSLLGEKYIALLGPTSGAPYGRLGNGDNIPLSSTGRNPEVEEVLGALSLLLSGGGVSQIKIISTEMNNALNGRTDTMRQVLSNVNQLVTVLNNQRGQIVNAMSAINRLSGTLSRERKTVGAAIDAVGPAITVLNQQHKSLMAMLAQLDRLGAVGTSVMNQSRANLLATLKHIGPALQGLADAGDALPKGLSLLISFPFPKEAAHVVKGDYANAAFNLKLDFSNNTPPGGGIPNPVDLCKKAKAAVQQAIDKQVSGYVDQAVNPLPLTPALKKKVKQQLYNQLVRAVSDALLSAVDCQNPQNTISRIPGMLNKLGPQVLKALLRALDPSSLTKAICNQLGGLLTPAQQSKCRQLLPGVPLPSAPALPLPTLPALPGLGAGGFNGAEFLFGTGNSSDSGGLIGGLS